MPLWNPYFWRPTTRNPPPKKTLKSNSWKRQPTTTPPNQSQTSWFSSQSLWHLGGSLSVRPVVALHLGGSRFFCRSGVMVRVISPLLMVENTWVPGVITLLIGVIYCVILGILGFPQYHRVLRFADECSELCHGVCFCVHPVTMLHKRGELKEAHSQRTNRNSCKTDHIWDMIMVCTPNLAQRPYCTAQECKYLHKNLCNHCTTHQLKSLVSEKEAHSQHPKDQHAKRTKSPWSWYATPNLVQRPYCTAPGMKVSPQILCSHCTTHITGLFFQGSLQYQLKQCTIIKENPSKW